MTLVTGASGFVGRWVVDALNDRNEPVRALVRNPDHADQFRRRGVDVVVGDVCDLEAVRRAAQGVGVIYHCAAAVGERYSRRDFHETNVEGTRRLLETAAAVGCRRVVLLSSLHVLGIGDLDGVTEAWPRRRTYDPASNAKIDMELMAAEVAHRSQIEIVILRPGVIYGPCDPHNLPKLIAALRDGRFRFLGSRLNLVPVVHVADVAEAMLLAARVPQANGQTYHITDGTRTTVGEFIDRLAELCGAPKPKRVLSAPMVRVLKVLCALARCVSSECPLPIGPGPLRFLATSRYVDIHKARTELGYAPRFGYRNGLNDAMDETSVPSFQTGKPHVVPV